MASKLLEVLAGVVAPTLAALGAEELTKVFAKVHEKSPKRHALLLRTLNVALQELKPITDESKTKFDNVAVDALGDAVVNSAEEFDVDLYEIDEDDDEEDDEEAPENAG